MITKTTMYEDGEGDDRHTVLEFPELDTINIGDPDMQKQLIKWGVAVGVPGGEMICTKAVKLVAGGDKS